MRDRQASRPQLARWENRATFSSEGAPWSGEKIAPSAQAFRPEEYHRHPQPLSPGMTKVLPIQHSTSYSSFMLSLRGFLVSGAAISCLRLALGRVLLLVALAETQTIRCRFLCGLDRAAAISTRSAEDIARAAQAFVPEDDITVVTLALIPAEVARA